MTDNYFVRLAATMEGEDAGDAVLAFVDRMTEKGLRDWLYRVDDKATGEMVGYFNGWGEQIDTDIVHQATEAIRLESANTTASDTHADPEPDEDAELEQLAESLNSDGATQE